MNTNKNIFVEQQQYAIKIADIYNSKIKKQLTTKSKLKAVFPSPDSIYNLDVVIRNDPSLNSLTTKKFSEDYTPKEGINLNKMINKIVKKLDHNLNETTSTSSREDITYTESNSQTSEMGRFKLFTCRESSRFNFVKNTNEPTPVEVPEFIRELIVKKASTHKLTKYMKNVDDILYQDTKIERNKKDDWVKFLLENKSNTNTYIDDDKILIDDFERITKFILDTRQTYK